MVRIVKRVRRISVFGGFFMCGVRPIRITITMLKVWNYVTKMCNKSVTK